VAVSGFMRIGIDLGGTKIEALALSSGGKELDRVRIPTIRTYNDTITAIKELVCSLEIKLNRQATVGIGMPGSITRATGLVKNSNSAWLNGRPFQQDISIALNRTVRCANDANCFAVSEATDGSAASYEVVLAVILGTGCGSGVAFRGRIHEGRNRIAGEWGHNSLPWPTEDEYPGDSCYCGKRGCLETWISGTSLGKDYTRVTGIERSGIEVAAAAAAGESEAIGALKRLEDRLARGLSSVVHILDPDIIVLGGGLSLVESLYTDVPKLLADYSFGGGADTPIVAAKHGDSSGVRGAAWLWPAHESNRKPE
jgi:fructokinase